jgi:hypothetical protein
MPTNEVESLGTPEEVFFSFLADVDFSKPNASVVLTDEELDQWDGDDDDAREEFRKGAAQELLAMAEEQGAGYALFFDEEDRVLLLACEDEEAGWLYLETEEEFRPTESDVFEV